MKKYLIPILLLNLLLNLWGIGWGLPNRWHVDESVGTALAIGASRSLAPVMDSQGYGHPALYELVLTGLLALYAGILFITGYPIGALRSSGISSWVELAEKFPDFAIGAYLVSRAFSAILGMLSVWLIYRLGKELFGRRAALLGALTLSVTMGFVGANHFAKRDVLLNLLFILVLLYCVKALNKPKRSYLLFAGLIAGFCIGIKHNGLIALFPLLLVMIFRWRAGKDMSSLERWREAMYLAILILLGYLTGIPMALTAPRYLIGPFLSFFYSLTWPGQGIAPGIKEASAGLTNFLARIVFGPVNYLIELASLFGLFLFFFVLKGIYHSLRNVRGVQPAEWIVLSTLLFYFLIIVNTSFSIKYAQTKGILLIVPLLACYAGLGLSRFLAYGVRQAAAFRKVLIGGIFFYSLLYTIQADFVFINGDTRYQATSWVRRNLPKGSTIEITKQIDRVISCEILKDYRVIYLGKVVDMHHMEMFSVSPAESEGDQYFNQARREGSTAEYIIESFEYAGDIDDLISGRMCYVQRDLFRGELLSGRYNYELVKRFDPTSVKLRSSLTPYLCYVRPLLWNPVPQIGYVSPTIMVFKRKEPL